MLKIPLDACRLLLQILILAILMFHYTVPLKAHNLKPFRFLSSTHAVVHCSRPPLHNWLEISSGFLLKFICDHFIASWCCTNIILWLSTMSALIPEVFMKNHHILFKFCWLNYPNPHFQSFHKSRGWGLLLNMTDLTSIQCVDEVWPVPCIVVLAILHRP